ncbi:hypothetical protein GW17_00000864 [Ensete ventricosum]|nr:hypothetical protein GW17_00000864 [Ensete ventricosum]
MAATAFAAASPPAAVLSGSRLPAPGSASLRAPVLLLPPPPRRSFSSPPISLSSSQPRASKDHGISGSRIHWMVCIPLPTFQGKLKIFYMFSRMFLFESDNRSSTAVSEAYDSRKELANDVEALKKKIAGTGE